jgi:glycosyltransferase involved in cell wall biosynthesis
MVQLMLDGLGGDQRRMSRNSRQCSGGQGIECYHVNARFSDNLQDIGHVRVAKFFLLIGYCLQAILFRFRYGLDTLYYIPAPGKRTALYRDWVVLSLCRPFFRRTVLHWHAAGLAKWLEREANLQTRKVTFAAYKHADLSLVLSDFNRLDAEKMLALRVEKLPNGIPDPCPGFEQAVLPRRRARALARGKLLAGQQLTAADLVNAEPAPEIIQVLFLGHCMRTKGVFDAVETVAKANENYRKAGLPLRVHLNVAGEFVDAGERAEFERRIQSSGGEPWVTYLGFVSGERKRTALQESDCMCFPSYYPAESFGLVLVEAMAFGLPIVTTRWRSLPELFPTNYAGLVEICQPEQGAAALQKLMSESTGEEMRALFLERFTIDRFLSRLAEVLRGLDTNPPKYREPWN